MDPMHLGLLQDFISLRFECVCADQLVSYIWVLCLTYHFKNDFFHCSYSRWLSVSLNCFFAIEHFCCTEMNTCTYRMLPFFWIGIALELRNYSGNVFRSSQCFKISIIFNVHVPGGKQLALKLETTLCATRFLKMSHCYNSANGLGSPDTVSRWALGGPVRPWKK